MYCMCELLCFVSLLGACSGRCVYSFAMLLVLSAMILLMLMIVAVFGDVLLCANAVSGVVLAWS